VWLPVQMEVVQLTAQSTKAKGKGTTGTTELLDGYVMGSGGCRACGKNTQLSDGSATKMFDGLPLAELPLKKYPEDMATIDWLVASMAPPEKKAVLLMNWFLSEVR